MYNKYLDTGFVLGLSQIGITEQQYKKQNRSMKREIKTYLTELGYN